MPKVIQMPGRAQPEHQREPIYRSMILVDPTEESESLSKIQRWLEMGEMASAASPIPNSNCSSAIRRSNRRPCPLASMPTRTSGRLEHGRTSPPRRDALAAFPGTLRSRYPPKLFLETRYGNLLLIMIIVRLLSPEPVGWFCHHQLTRVSEPTLSWNQ
jgi:hypothetical protein